MSYDVNSANETGGASLMRMMVVSLNESKHSFLVGRLLKCTSIEHGVRINRRG